MRASIRGGLLRAACVVGFVAGFTAVGAVQAAPPVPTVSITAPSNNASYAEGPAITLTATATVTGDTIASVQFYDGTTLLGNGTANGSSYSFNWQTINASLGAHTIKATATGSLGGTASSSVNVTLLAPIPTVSIVAPANNSSFAQGTSVTLSASAGVIGDNITSVQFYDGSTLLGSVDFGRLNRYSFAWSTTGASVGSHTITAVANGQLGGTATSAPITVNITSSSAPTPTVSITAPANNTSYTQGATVALTATATVSGDTISSVQFYDGTTLLGSGTASGSTYTYNWGTSGAAIGGHSISAKATGALGGTATSTAITVNITSSAPTPSVSITAPANNSSYTRGATVALTATATVSGDTISSVQFYDGTTLLGSGTASGSTYTYSWSTTSATVAAHSITAKATGTRGGTATSSAVTVNITAPTPTVSITAPANNSSYAQGATIALTATVTVSGDTISSVQFYDGTTLLGSGTASGSTYTYSWVTTSAATGGHSITAKATGTLGGTATSSAITVSITSSAPTPTVSITAPANNSSYVQGATVALTATATVSGDTISSVQFYDGATLLGNGTASGSTYSYSWVTTSVATGAHSITAKATGVLGGTASSSAITVAITSSSAPTPTVSIIAPANNSSYLKGASVALTAAAAVPGDTISSVQFYDGTTLLGSGSVDGGTYAYSWSTAGTTAASHSITAKATGSLGGTATSNPITVEIALPLPMVSITGPANNSSHLQGTPVTLTATATVTGDTISSVQFYDGTTLLGSGTASGSTYTYNWSTTGTAVATHSITAKATSNLGATTSSASVAVNITSTAPIPTISWIVPANNSSFALGSSVTLNASVTLTGDTVASTQFYDGSTPIGAPVLGIRPTQWWDTSSVTTGSHSITATVTGNLGGTATTSPITVNITASGPTPVVSMTYPANNASYPEGSTLVVTVTATVTGDTISNVLIYDGTTRLGTATYYTGNSYTFDWVAGTAPTVGSHTFTAKAFGTLGGSATSSPVTFTITSSRTVSITAPANNSTIGRGATVALIANASGDITSGVQFYDGTTLLGSGTISSVQGPSSWTYTYDWVTSGAALGSHSITAKATGAGGTTTSSAVALTLTGPPTVSITAPAGGGSYAQGTTVTATANATSGAGIQSITFYDGAKAAGTVFASGSSPATVSFSWTLTSSTPIGAHTLTAVAADTSGDTTTSAAVTVSVVPPSNVPTVTLLSPSKSQTVLTGSAPVLIATATANQGTLAQVQFFDGLALIGTATASGSTYTLTWNKPVPGAHVIIAKATDSLGASWTAQQTVTVPNVGPSKWVASGGYPAAYNYTPSGTLLTVGGDWFGLGLSGAVYACGDNSTGLLGTGNTVVTNGWQTIQLPAGVSAIALSVNQQAAAAIGSDGNVYVWGNATYGQIPKGTPLTPLGMGVITLAPGVSALSVSTGIETVLAIGSDGNLYGWGWPTSGELGNGASTSSSAIYQPFVVNLPGGASPIAIASGFASSYAIASDGVLYALGANQYGQLGNGTTTNALTPTAVAMPAGVSAVSISADPQGYVALVIGTDGNLYGFGLNSSGSLGDGTTVNRAAPVRVALPAGVTALEAAAGAGYSIARGSDGNLYAWGSETSPVSYTPTVLSLSYYSSYQAIGIAEEGVSGAGGLILGSDGLLHPSQGYGASSVVDWYCLGSTALSAPAFTTAKGALWSGVTTGQSVQANGFTLTAEAGPTLFGTYAFSLYEGATLLQTQTQLSSTGAYTFQLTTTAGSHTYTATIVGPDGTSQTTPALTVNAVGTVTGPTISLLSPATGVSVRSYNYFVGRAQAQAGSAPVTAVNYYLGTTLVASAQAGVPVDVYAKFAPGNYSFYATAVDTNGNSAQSPAVPITITPADNVAITSPANNSTVAASTSIQLTASAATLVPGATVTQVAYYYPTYRGNYIGASSTPPFAVTWANVPAGVYTVTATAFDSSGALGTSAPITVQVLAAGTTAGTVNVTYLHTDVAGSPLAATDNTGTVVLWRENYQPFGTRDVNATAASTNRQFFHDKAADPESGLSYFGARYYDPVVGRFTGVDPKEFEDGDFRSFNRYAYGNNNPYHYVDPDGNSTVDPYSWYLFGRDVGSLLVTEIVYGIAAANGNEAVKQMALEQMQADVGAAAIATLGVVNPVPGTSGATIIQAVKTTVRVARTASGKRVGDFTRKDKVDAKAENADKNNGQMKCEDCGKKLRNVKSEKGVSTPNDQAQVHHDPAISEGGGRESKPVVLCPDCHQERHRQESAQDGE